MVPTRCGALPPTLAGFEQAATGAVWSNAVEEQSLWRGLFRKQVPQAVSAGTGLVVRDEPASAPHQSPQGV